MPSRVSVIIPTYNRQDYVQEAIDSVLAQTYTDYEIIVVDDGSTDGTGEALRAAYGHRIRYVCQENQGGSAARNTGAQQAVAPYLLFLDSDDLLLGHALDTLLAVATEAPEAGLIGAAYEYVDVDGEVVGQPGHWRTEDSLDLRARILSCRFIPSATLVQSMWFDAVGGFDPGQEAAQDWDLWLRLALAGCAMESLNQVVCQYRLHSRALTANPTRQHRAALRALDKVFDTPNLPSRIEGLRSKAYARIYIMAATRKYAAGQIDEAKAHVDKAAILVPSQVHSGALVEGLLRAGRSPVVTDDPESYAATVLANLPQALDVDGVRRRAVARLAAGDFFRTQDDSDWRETTALWWNMVSADPSWLRNVGVWSITAEAVLGSSATDRMRAVYAWMRHVFRRFTRLDDV